MYSENCEMQDCEKTCTQIPGHEGFHKSSYSHPCGKLCKSMKNVGQFCKHNSEFDNGEHYCEGKCPFISNFYENHLSSSDHFMMNFH